MNDFDLIIIGGGMVGGALACALGNSPLRIALLEAEPAAPLAADAPFELRVSAFSLANQRFLENVGVWSRLEASGRVCPFDAMRVWEDGGAATRFDCADIDAPALGYFAENRLLQENLLERCQDFSNIELLRPVETRSISIEADQVVVRCHNRTLRARLLIGADGARSKVREAACIGTHAWDYEQAALVVTILSDLPQQHMTWQRFTPSGPQAFLPLAQRHASLVWYHRPDQVRRLRALPDQDFLSELETAFPPELGGIQQMVGRASFPLRRMHAHRYVQERVALLGDAAHTVHPLAGQGVNMGLLDAAVLAEVLLDATAKGRDPGALNALRKYERWRRHDNLLMLTATDAFYRTFSNTNPVLRLARNSGMYLADGLRPLKHQAMRVALGLAGRQPRLTLPGQTVLAP